MKSLGKGVPKMMAVVLAAALICCSANMSVVEVSATEPMAEEIFAEVIIPADTEPVMNMSLEDGVFELADGNHAAWIDRMDLTGADDIRAVYDKLVEASDNDGVDDFLIDDSYYENESGSRITVAMINGTVGSKEEINAVLNDVASRYGMYVSAAANAFDKDHPEVFWLSGSTAYKFGYGASQQTPGNWSYTIYVYLCLKDTVNGAPFDIREEVYQSEAAIKEAIAERDECVKEYMDAVEGDSAYEKVLYFNEQLTKTNQYNTSADLSAIDNNCRECISALKGSIGEAGPVCEGYARAFKVLCDAAGIPCTIEEGYAFNGLHTEAHMWNYVQMKDTWYAADVTWDDPVPSTGGSGAVSGYENTDYLLVGSNTMNDGYTFSNSHVVYNWLSSAGVGLTNGPIISESAYDPNAVVTSTVSGSVTCGKVEDDEVVTIQLIPEGKTDAAYTATASEGVYSVSDVEDGTYTLRVSRAKHVTRDYAVTVAGENLTQDVKICLLGDVTGDGKVNTMDVGRAYSHAKNTSLLEGYALECANVVGSNNTVNTMDVGRIYAHVRKSNPFW